jgi:hypothetical protein
MTRRWLWIGLLLFLTACQPTQGAPVQTPTVLRVNLSSSLGWLGTYFNACAIQNTGLAVVVDFKPGGSLNLSDADFTFLWGSSANEALVSGSGFRSQVGWDDLAWVVHPDNPIQQFTQTDLENIFSGAVKTYPQTAKNPQSPIHLYQYPQGEDAQQIMIGFTGQAARPSSTVSIVPDPDAMRTTIAADPAGLGFLPKRWLDNSIRAVEVRGDDTQLLHQPVIALAQAEPQGTARKWLYCIQQVLK